MPSSYIHIETLTSSQCHPRIFTSRPRILFNVILVYSLQDPDFLSMSSSYIHIKTLISSQYHSRIFTSRPRLPLNAILVYSYQDPLRCVCVGGGGGGGGNSRDLSNLQTLKLLSIFSADVCCWNCFFLLL